MSRTQKILNQQQVINFLFATGPNRIEVIAKHLRWSVQRTRNVCEKLAAMQWLDAVDDIYGLSALPNAVFGALMGEETALEVPDAGRQRARKAWATMRRRVAKTLETPKRTAPASILERPLESLMQSAILKLFRNEVTAPKIRYGECRKTSAGYYSAATQEIVIRSGRDSRSTLMTIVHELCHHAHPGAGHGQAWQRRMIEVGLMPAGTPRSFTQSEIPGGMFERWVKTLDP